MKRFNQELLEYAEFLNSKELSDRTIKEYLSYYRKFPPDYLDLREAITKFLNRNPNNVSRAFVNSYLEFKDRYDIRVPRKTGRRKKKVIVPLSKDEVRRMALAMFQRNEKYGMMFELNYYCALRLQELLGLKFTDFKYNEWHRNQNQPCLLHINYQVGKGKRERIVFVPPNVMQNLIDYLTPRVKLRDYKKETLFPISQRRWQVLMIKAGEKAIGRKVNPHLLRHSRATHLERDGWKLTDIQGFLGHTSVTTTELYIKHDNEERLQRMKNYLSES